MPSLRLGTHLERRMVADRWRRIWTIVQYIVDHPGASRHQLSEVYHLSERQVQADLMLIKDSMRLPLVRRRGYRFLDESGTAPPSVLTLDDALALICLLGAGRRARVLPHDQITDLATRLPTLFPIHLRPIAARALGPDASPLFPALADAIVKHARVQLGCNRGQDFDGHARVTIAPEFLVPYQGSWFVVGHTNEYHRLKMLPLDRVATVAFVDARGRAAS